MGYKDRRQRYRQIDCYANIFYTAIYPCEFRKSVLMLKKAHGKYLKI
jgi:hypothetical protein